MRNLLLIFATLFSMVGHTEDVTTVFSCQLYDLSQPNEGQVSSTSVDFSAGSVAYNWAETPETLVETTNYHDDNMAFSTDTMVDSYVRKHFYIPADSKLGESRPTAVKFILGTITINYIKHGQNIKVDQFKVFIPLDYDGDALNVAAGDYVLSGQSSFVNAEVSARNPGVVNYITKALDIGGSLVQAKLVCRGFAK